MNTKERILATSLELFNSEGEAHVTTVDIANELDMSPGNLYYHFKGKEPIIKALFDSFESELVDALEFPADSNPKTEDAWFFIYSVFEIIYKYRFVYLNLHDIFHRLPVLQKRFQRLQDLQVTTCRLMLLALVEKGILITDEENTALVATTISMTMTYWLSYSALSIGDDDPELILHQGVFQMMSILTPHLAETEREIYRQALQILKRAID